MRQRSSAAPLALVYAALLLYASLYPFSGWRWPPGPSLGALLVLPWPPWRDPFDVWSNVLGYVPLGALLYVAQVRGGRAAWRAALLAVMAAVLIFRVRLGVIKVLAVAAIGGLLLGRLA